MSITSLPPELLAAIFGHLQPEPREAEEEPITVVQKLKCLRLTCRALLPEATKELFKSVHLLPTEDSVYGWQSLALHDGLKAYARQAVIDTCVRNSQTPINRKHRIRTRPLNWMVAVTDLRRFPKVEDVTVRFSSMRTRAENTTFQHQVLDTVVDALGEMNTDLSRKGPKVSQLTIENMHNSLPTRYPASYFILQEHLRGLHVSVCTEQDPELTLNEFLQIVDGFWPRFNKLWLHPTTPKLTDLTLYCDDCWLFVVTTQQLRRQWLTSFRVPSACICPY